MPLPWKKTNNGRISRLVADLRSSNHGESLVVQTGFPTSLIDLFVQNRDRLKKSPKQKKTKTKKKKLSEVSDPSPAPATVPPCLNSSSGSMSSVTSLLVSVSAPEITVSSVSEEIENVVKVSIPTRGFRKFVILFLLLILAFGTKKLVIGVTASAFALLFLEFTGKRVFYFLQLRQCLVSQRRFNSLLLDTVLTRKETGLKESSVVINDFGGVNEGDRVPIEEIQIVEPDLELVSCEKRYEFTESDLNTRILGKGSEDLGNRKTKTSKIKALLKKLRRSKNRKNSEDHHQDSNRDIFNSIVQVEQKVSSGEEQEKKKEDEQREPEDEEVSEEHKDEVPSSSDVSLVEFGTDVIGENMGRRKTERGLRCQTVFFIVLAGLVGGRVTALVLIILWCLLVKSMRTAIRISKISDWLSSLRVKLESVFAERSSFLYS